MIRYTVSSLLFLALAGCLLAQNPADHNARINGIRDIFNKTNAKIATTKKSGQDARMSSVSVDRYITNALDRSWEGVGNYKVTYTYYYIHNPAGGQNRLLKISVATESAARHYHEEFYYDSSGQLIFYFHKTNDSDFPKERRVYLQNGKAIRLIDDSYSRDSYTDGDKEIVEKIYKREKAIKRKFSDR